MSRPVVLAAAGGLAREVLAELRESDTLQVVGLVDDDERLWGTTIGEVPVLGALDCLRPRAHEDVVICAGQGGSRRRIRQRLSALGFAEERFPAVIASSVRVPASCSVGAGSVILAGTVLTADVSIGRHVVVMPNVTLTHDNHLADHVTVCAGVSLGGSVAVGEDAYLGMNASVRQGLHIGRGAVLGMGSVLVRHLPAGEVWAGVPAARLRPVSRPDQRPTGGAADPAVTRLPDQHQPLPDNFEIVRQ